MKAILILLFFIYQTVVAETILEVNNENLTWLALKNSPPKVIEDYVLYLAKTKHSREYYKNTKNKDVLTKLFSKIRAQLQVDLLTTPKDSKYLLTYDSKYLSYDLLKESMRIKSFSNIPQKPILRDYSKRDGLPDYFNLLFANIDLLNEIKMDKKEFEGFLKRRKTNKKVYVEMVLMLPKFQNGQNFQTIISEVKIYDSSKKKYLLGAKKEQTSIEEITSQLFLKEGITNKLIGIHAFDFFGYRLQDQLIESSNLRNYCKKVIKRDIHQVIVCKRPATENTTLVITYLGGIVAQIDLIATDELSPKEINKIKHAIKNDLNKRKITDEISTKWSRHGVDFEFYSDALYGTRSIESTYIFPDTIEYNPSIKQYTLIVTMMPQATKKLLENLNET